jgi:hypothetical protein
VEAHLYNLAHNLEELKLNVKTKKHSHLKYGRELQLNEQLQCHLRKINKFSYYAYNQALMDEITAGTK